MSHKQTDITRRISRPANRLTKWRKITVLSYQLQRCVILLRACYNPIHRALSTSAMIQIAWSCHDRFEKAISAASTCKIAFLSAAEMIVCDAPKKRRVPESHVSSACFSSRHVTCLLAWLTDKCTKLHSRPTSSYVNRAVPNGTGARLAAPTTCSHGKITLIHLWCRLLSASIIIHS